MSDEAGRGGGKAGGSADAAADRADAPPIELPPVRASILIVDDKPQNLFVLTEALAGLGEEVVQARTGAEALRRLLRQDFALILLDVQMPDMDGYELASLVRQRPRSQHTPIIFITAYNKEDQDISRGYALGAVDYVFKPLDAVVLKAKAAVFVDLFKKTEAVRRQAELERRLTSEALRARTEKLEMERALRQVEERQSHIVRSLPIALYTADLDGQFCGPRFLSERIAGTVGFPAAAFVEDPDLWPARIHPADLKRVLHQVASIGGTGQMSAEYRWRCADGSERIFLDQAVVVRDEDGRAAEILGTCLDVTDRRQLEQQLLQSQKMEAIGQLTGGIAHDFNNMLSVIIWNLDALTRRLDGSGKPYDHVQMALAGALKCAELVRQLLTFARNQPHRAQVIQLGELVPRMGRLLGPMIGEQIGLDVRLPDTLWPVFADPAQVESALLNLAINARDAMPNGGTLTIAAENMVHSDDRIDPEPGDYVVLSISDTGVGMPPEVSDRAFEPFFTTKSPDQGNGLGLSMVYGFAKQSNGHVRIESEIGRGTTVRLYLPRTDPARLTEQEIAAEEAAEIDGGRTILVVEDNPVVLRVATARLQELGHEVLEATDGKAALDVLRSDAHIDLLFTDVVMPGGVSGIELARQARELRPGLKILFTSGYAAYFQTTGGVTGELLQKPYRNEDLARALRRAMAGPAAPPADAERHVAARGAAQATVIRPAPQPVAEKIAVPDD